MGAQHAEKGLPYVMMDLHELRVHGVTGLSLHHIYFRLATSHNVPFGSSSMNLPLFYGHLSLF